MAHCRGWYRIFSPQRHRDAEKSICVIKNQSDFIKHEVLAISAYPCIKTGAIRAGTSASSYFDSNVGNVRNHTMVRLNLIISNAIGKRLTYEDLIA